MVEVIQRSGAVEVIQRSGAVEVIQRSRVVEVIQRSGAVEVMYRSLFCVTTLSSSLFSLVTNNFYWPVTVITATLYGVVTHFHRV